MNERILSPRLLELVQSAGPGYSQADPEWVKKFAELIVRECANMAESFHHYQYDFTGNLELHEFIKEHFGVEL